MGKVRSWNELLALQPPPIEFIIPELLTVGGTMVIYGDVGVGKSWLALELHAALSNGGIWLGWQCKPVTTLLLQTEQPEALYRKRVLKMSLSMNGSTPKAAYFESDMAIKLDNPYGIGMLRASVQQVMPQAIIIDTYYHVVSGSENDDVMLKRLTDGLNRIRQDFGCAFILLAHPRKMQFGDDGELRDAGADELAGHSDFKRWIDTIIKMSPLEGDKVIVSYQKTRVAEAELRNVRLMLRFDRQTARFKLA